LETFDILVNVKVNIYYMISIDR